jgi:hypothetical protein
MEKKETEKEEKEEEGRITAHFSNEKNTIIERKKPPKT